MITLFYYIFFFGLGAIIGSFLNVVSLRMNTGKSIVNSRSSCFNCAKQLSWYELIPVFSFVFQKGKCRNCKSRISLQYISVEIITGLLFVALANMYISGALGFEILFPFIIFSILVVIFIYDIRHMIIPDSLSFLFSFFALVSLMLAHGSSLLHMPGLLDLLAGPILALPFALIWLVSNGKWMGLGDAKLALGIGWFLGLTPGITSIVFAFWIGAVISVGILMVTKLLKRNSKHTLSFKSEIPFAPFLIIGLTIVFFSHFDLVRFLI